MGQRWRGLLLEAAETLILSLVIFLIAQTFIIQPYVIDQHSMERTLEPGQFIFVDKLTPHWDDYKRGDVVVFAPPSGYQEGKPDEPFIKRVIATAGQEVEIQDGKVWVDGQPLDEPYVYDGQPTTARPGGVSQWFVGQGQLFVLGDHREDSTDSRVFGTIPKSSVIGRAWIRYWPLGNFGFLPTRQAAAP